MAPLAKQMFSDPGDEPAVIAAWESFLDGAEQPAETLRALVDSSWQRCLHAQVDPHARSGPQPLPDQDLYLLRERGCWWLRIHLIAVQDRCARQLRMPCPAIPSHLTPGWLGNGSG